MQYALGFLMTLCFFVSMGSYAQAQTLAFPGAEGFGRLAKGGRGGQVIEVTNLNNSGPGSLRAALEASGPRTVVFRVGGTINLNGKITILNPFVTIAGQTAPGGGIQIKGGGISVRTNDVIIRYIRIRPGVDVPNPSSSDALQLAHAAHDIIIDHVSAFWGIDEVVSFSGSDVQDITLQWSIVAEGLGQVHRGLLFNGGLDNITVHHTLLAQNQDRNPLIKGGNVDYVNNVHYNWIAGANIFPKDATVKLNFVGNYYLRGASSPSSVEPLMTWGTETYSGGSSLYINGNIEPVVRPSNSLPELDILKLKNNPALTYRSSSFSYPLVTTTDAFNAYNDVLAGAGATLPVRDAADVRIVNQVKNKTGTYISNESQVGGHPNLASGSAPADSDHDGMSNSWESANGFNPNNASDGSQDADGDGYTNLEEFLNNTSPGSGDNNDPPMAPTNLRVIAN